MSSVTLWELSNQSKESHMSYKLHHGDCRIVLRSMEANSIDTCITDPPYGLTDIEDGL